MRVRKVRHILADIGLFATLALTVVGCGPSAQQRRACEMFTDAGGMTPQMESVEFWLKRFSEPKAIADTEQRRIEWRKNLRKYPHLYPNPDVQPVPSYLGTPQQQSEGQAEYSRKKNAEARGVVALRLTMSQREVNDALVACGDEMIAQASRARLTK
jgi:hypothetical protein